MEINSIVTITVIDSTQTEYSHPYDIMSVSATLKKAGNLEKNVYLFDQMPFYESS